MKMKYTLLIAVLLSSFGFMKLNAQEAKVKKANEDFNRFDYIDAREIYLKVVEDGYASAQVYENLGDTYYWNSDYVNAAKWYGKLVEEFPDQTKPIYFYRAAQAFKSTNEEDKADIYMNMYVSKSGDDGMMGATVTNYTTFDARLNKVDANSSYSDFGATFLGKNVVFASSRPGATGEKIHNWMGQPFTDLYVGYTNDEGNITTASQLKGDVNTKYHETTPTFTKDGETMYFTRNNFIDGKKGKGKNKTINLKIYKATLSEGSWTNVKELPFNSDDYSVAHPALSPDEKRLYFSAEMPNGQGMSDIWYVDILGEDSYSDPKNLSSINTPARESFPYISESNMLYFATDGRGGLGGYDVFRAKLDAEGNATEITNLGEPVNSHKDDFGFVLNEKTRIGYISSNRGGEEGSIDDDIYTVVQQCIVTIAGKVYDEDSGEILAGALVSIADENNEVVATYVSGEDGMYTFDVDCDKQYNIRATLDDYEPHEELVNTPNKTSDMNVPMPLHMLLKNPCPDNDLGCRLDLQPIYFDFDRYNIRPDAEVELAKILNAMELYPELIIHIESHTDSRGSLIYNDELSEKRAQSTLEWLVKKGIDRNRLTAKGYGERQLVNRCSDGVECTEEEHQLNRRSMFIIQN